MTIGVKAIIGSLLVASLFDGGLVQAQMKIEPSNGKTPEQQNQDISECQVWAKEQTNSEAASADEIARKDKQKKGWVRSAGVAAATGSPVGLAVNGVRNRRLDHQAEEREENNYNQAFTACMEGRGYRISSKH